MEELKNNDSLISKSVSNLNDEDYKIICEAAIVFIFDTNKLERLNSLNQSLVKKGNDYKEIVKWIIKIVLLTVRQKIDEKALSKHFTVNFGIDEHKSNILKELYIQQSPKFRAKLENHNLVISQLVDIDWSFGVTTSTNYVDKLGNAFMQLKLIYNNGFNLETSFIELTLPQFYSFLHEMNKAKSQIDYLS